MVLPGTLETEPNKEVRELPHGALPVLIICALLASLTLAVSVGVVSTWEQVRHICELPAYIGTVPQHIQSALLKKLPIGSSRGQVQAYLTRCGLGADGHSICASIGKSSLNCKIPARHPFWELIRETYAISFGFDSNPLLSKTAFWVELSMGKQAPL